MKNRICVFVLVAMLASGCVNLQKTPKPLTALVAHQLVDEGDIYDHRYVEACDMVIKECSAVAALENLQPMVDVIWDWAHYEHRVHDVMTNWFKWTQFMRPVAAIQNRLKEKKPMSQEEIVKAHQTLLERYKRFKREAGY